MSIITESLASGFANQMKREADVALGRFHQRMSKPRTGKRSVGPIWRDFLTCVRDIAGVVIHDVRWGEKKRAHALFFSIETKLRVEGIVFLASLMSAKEAIKFARPLREVYVDALISGHAQRRAIQALGPDARVYGPELLRHAAVAQNHPSVAATFSDLGIALWREDAGFPVCTTYIPSDRLDKWSSQYSRWKSGLPVDGVMSAARNLDEVIHLVMLGGGE